MTKTTTTKTKASKTKKSTKSTSAINKAYLMWVGSEHYKDIAEWSDEAVSQGISKRLPNAAMGKALMEPGTVVFVAHDEGETTQCTHCSGNIECPDCRKRTVEMANLRAAIDSAKKRFAGDWETEATDGMKRFESVREAKIDKLEQECEDCAACGGKGKLKGGTGGSVTLKDGRKWDYRTFNYWLHQPTKFHAESMVATKAMCEKCGGTGEMPEAKLFGVFAPQRVEYIMRGDETKDELAALKEFGLVRPEALKVEHKRKCGYRKPGGVYAVTDKVGTGVTDEMVKALRERGVDTGAVDITGNFIKFAKPIKVDVKRFRGIKQIPLGMIAAAATAAALIADAMED